MDFVTAFFPLVLMIPFYILPLWLLWRAVHAIERIADKIERTTDNENTKE